MTQPLPPPPLPLLPDLSDSPTFPTFSTLSTQLLRLVLSNSKQRASAISIRNNPKQFEAGGLTAGGAGRGRGGGGWGPWLLGPGPGGAREARGGRWRRHAGGLMDPGEWGGHWQKGTEALRGVGGQMVSVGGWAGGRGGRPRGRRRLRVRGRALGLALLAGGLLPGAARGEAMGYPFCLNGCGAAGQCNDGSSGRPADGRCVCTDGRGGRDCSSVRPGISLRAETSTADYSDTSGAVFDQQNGMVYMRSRSTGSNRDGIIEFDPGAMELSGVQPDLLETPLASGAGAGTPSNPHWSGSKEHPRADPEPFVSEGHFGLFKELQVDGLNTELNPISAVFVPQNMWRAVDDGFGNLENNYQSRIHKYGLVSDGSRMALPSSPSASSTTFPYYLDCMAVNPDGLVIAKFTEAGSGGAPGTNRIIALDSDMLVAKDEALEKEGGIKAYYRFETSTYVAKGLDEFVVFVGTYRVSSTPASSYGSGEYGGSFFPVVWRTGATTLTMRGTPGGLQTELAPLLPVACEGRDLSDLTESGRYSTFSVIVPGGDYLYLGTKSRAEQAPSRSACIIKVELSNDQGELALPANSYALVLKGASGEKDVHAGMVDDAGKFMYWSVGESGSNTFIVKVDVASFERIGSYEATQAVRSTPFLSGMRSILAVENNEAMASFSTFTTVEVTGFEPPFGPTSGGTSVTVQGNDFTDLGLTRPGQTHPAACRFGDPSVGWEEVPGSCANGDCTSIICVAPSSEDSYSELSGIAAVQISMQGYPSNGASVWTNDNIHFYYYLPPQILDFSPAAIQYLGEDKTTRAVTLSVRGGPFLDMGVYLKCRYDGDSSRVFGATYTSDLSGTEITCPVCETFVDVEFVTRCSNPIVSEPKMLSVAVSMNGVDFHDALDHLNAYGEASGLEISSSAQTAIVRPSVTTNSIGSVTLRMIDGSGNAVPEKQYNVRAEISASPLGSDPSLGDVFEAVTEDGEVTLTPAFVQPPLVGDYTLSFSANVPGCLSAACLVSGSASLPVVVVMGDPAGLRVTPDSLTLESDYDFGTSLGRMIVETVDAAGNVVGPLDTEVRIVSATAVFQTLDPTLSGASLVGTLSLSTSGGVASFVDLELEAAAIAGSEPPYTYGEPAGGSYLVSFTSPGLTTGTALVAVNTGEISYLKVTLSNDLDGNERGYQKISRPARASVDLPELLITAFDGGNNRISSDVVRTVDVSVSPEGTELGGSTSFKLENGILIIEAGDLLLLTPSWGTYTLTFETFGVQATQQVVEIVPGTTGDFLRIIPPLEMTYKSKSEVKIEDFTIEVADGGGNSLGVYDRENGLPVDRTLILSSTTLVLTPETFQTTFKGNILISNLVFLAPKAGTHTVEVRDSLGRLTETTMEIIITPGDPERLGLLLQTEDVLSSSYGGVEIADFAAFADEESVPLGNFTLQPEDIGQNQVKVLPPYEELFLTVIDETVEDYVSDVVEPSQMAPPPPSGAFSPIGGGFFGEEDIERVFTLEELVELNNSVTVEVSFSNVIQYQEDHPEFVKINTTMYSVTIPVATILGEGETVRIENTTTLYNSTRVTTKIHRVSITATFMDPAPEQFLVGDNQLTFQGTQLLGDKTRKIVEGEAIFSNLVLTKPAAGMYQFDFDPSDTSITSFNTQMRIVTGSPHHLGLHKSCATSPSPCTEIYYKASVATTLEEIEVLVLDGGDNFVGADDFTGPHTVTVKLISDGAALLGTTTLQTSSGAVVFNDLSLQRPLVGLRTLEFSAPGLYGTKINLMISTGEPHSLTLEPMEASALPDGVESLNAYESLHETNLTSKSGAIVVRILDGGGNKVTTQSEFETIVYAECDTATLQVGLGNTNYVVTENGIAYFDDLRLLAPPEGTHTIGFSSPGWEPTNLEVGVIKGPGLALKIKSFTTLEYEARVQTVIGELHVAIIDAGLNEVGPTNKIPRKVVLDIASPEGSDAVDFVISDVQDDIIRTGEGDLLFKEGNVFLKNPVQGTYVLTVRSVGLLPTSQEFVVVPGPPYALHVPQTWLAPNGKEYIFDKQYYSSRQVSVRPIPVIVVDGGGNFLGAQDPLRRMVEVNSDDVDLNGNTKFTNNGEVLLDKMKLLSPQTLKGKNKEYILTFSSSGLQSTSISLFGRVGYPSSIDVRDSLRTLYYSDRNVTLDKVEAQLLDAGGSWVESNYPERRNITVRLNYFIDKDGKRTDLYPSENSPEGSNEEIEVPATSGAGSEKATLLSHQPDASLPVVKGRSLWCTYDTEEWLLLGMKEGARPDACQDSFLALDHPKVGRYGFEFSSTCDRDRCKGMPGYDVYLDLTPFHLEVEIRPGKPSQLVFTQEPLRLTEHGYPLDPAPHLHALDVSGNLCIQENTFAFVKFTPMMLQTYGTVTAMIQGAAKFDTLRFVGRRGWTYDMTFSAPALDLETSFRNVTIVDCETVKPNSQPDGFGGCECVPGYTEDAFMSGYKADTNSLAAFPSIYSEVVHRPGNWVGALNPYGVCIPCAGGFYKPDPGPHPCTACPANMDTTRKDGYVAPEKVTLSNKVVEGRLAHVDLLGCHCIVQTEPPFESFYRNATAFYECEACPDGAICNGLNHTYVESLPGHYRTSRDSILFHDCPNPEACLGGVESACQLGNGTGYTGVLCTECLRGFERPTVDGEFPPVCTKCPSSLIAGVATLLQVLCFGCVFVAMFILNCRPRSSTVMLLKTCLTHMQCAAICRYFNLKWPSAVGFLFAIIEKLSTPELRTIASDCFLEIDFYGYVSLYVALPLVAAVAAGVYYMIKSAQDQYNKAKMSYRTKAIKADSAKASVEEGGEGVADVGDIEIAAADGRGTGGEFDAQAAEDRMRIGPADRSIACVLILIYVSYTTISRHLAQIFVCRDLTDVHPDHDRVPHKYLVADMSIQCGVSSHTTWVALAILFGLLYIVGAPLMWGLMLAVSDRTSNRIGYRFGFIFKGTYRETWWWEFLVLLRKLILVLAAVFAREDPVRGAYACIYVLEASIVMHLIIGPYESRRQHRLEFASLGLLLFTYHAGILYSSDSLDENLGNILGLALYVFNLAFLAFFARSLYKEMRKESKHEMIKRAKDDFKREDKIRLDFVQNELDNIKTDKLPRRAAELKEGFANNSLRDTIATSDVPDLRLKHLQLSMNLENIRNQWRETKTKGLDRLKESTLEDISRQRKKDMVPAERWKARKELLKPPADITNVAESAEATRPSWRDRLQDHQWRVQQRLAIRTADAGGGAARPDTPGGRSSQGSPSRGGRRGRQVTISEPGGEGGDGGPGSVAGRNPDPR